MEWNETQLNTIKEILDAALACKNKEEAALFMKAYKASTEHAVENLGYMAGYCSDDESQRIYDWFDCEHPIFGKFKPSAEEALSAGMRVGELSKTMSATEAAKIAKQELAEKNKEKNSFFMGINSVLKKMKESL